ncbi:MAG: LysR family transcriptional activator of nhaA [Pseudohongiellaceae bacterium]|jgi:LysR family transcriptional activator of nhaA
MRHLNYNHLQYFWTVAKEGSITKATSVLHLTPQTISGQLKLLEDSIGEALFSRVGRGLVLTETGHLVFQYADEIFSLGAELSSKMRSGDIGVPEGLKVGIVNSIPKLIAFRILKPALKSKQPLRLVCKEGNLEDLLGDLAVHQLDIIIADCAIPLGFNVKAYSHAIGESSIAFFCSKDEAKKYQKDFPKSLHKAPMLVPTTNNPVRSGIEDWFERQDISPRIVAEFEDSALMKVFGGEGVGVFPGPNVMRNEIEGMYGVSHIGSTQTVVENYYAISPERKLKHPIVLQLIESARQNLIS